MGDKLDESFSLRHFLSSPDITSDVNSAAFLCPTGSPEGDTDRHVGTLNGPQALPNRSLSPPVMASPNYAKSNVVPPPQWVSPVSAASAPDQYHQYNNPVAMVAGTFPRESRPKDLRLGNGSTTLQRITDLELNGIAIKERLMANRLPESCV
ncbi:hypothetical protein JTB14_007923 [Gonioctena quinquepunctata]|nr:hypothetical protein JTB14_007923 [Gonioctena quinquepunctata]